MRGISTVPAARESTPTTRRQLPPRDAENAVVLARKRRVEHRVGRACSATGAVGSPGRQRCAHLGHGVAGLGTAHSEVFGIRERIRNSVPETKHPESHPARRPRRASAFGHLVGSPRIARIGERGPCTRQNGSVGPIRPAVGPSIAARDVTNPAMAVQILPSRIDVPPVASSSLPPAQQGWRVGVADSVATHTAASPGVADRKYRVSADR